MAHELLGESFDIHGGGLDLQFPHHENEIAQSACAHPHGDFAHYWLHNEMLQVEGKKMSKSLGNFFTVRDLLEQGIPGEVIRFVLLMTHYRKPMDWTKEKARQAESTLRRWRSLANSAKAGGLVADEVLSSLRDDLNTAGAISALHRMAISIEERSHHEVPQGDYDDFAASARLLGLIEDSVEMGAWEFNGLVEKIAAGIHLRTLQERLAEARAAAMASKNFSAVDDLKSALIAAGVEVRMSKAGVELVPGPDFDPAKLEALQ
jgi:cysteinyl-tRNA synthetase